VLLPASGPPVETAVLPYSTKIDPLASVIESGCVPPTGPPVAKTEELTTVGCANAPVAMKRAAVDSAFVHNRMVVSPG